MVVYQAWEKPKTFLWKEAWHSIKAGRRTQAFNELTWSEAVSEAPLQVLFQTYAVTYIWQEDAPGPSQLISIALSLFNISVTNLQRQDMQYAWDPSQHSIFNWFRLSPYIIFYFCEAAYRTISTSLLIITLRAFSPVTALFMLWYRHKLVPLWVYDEAYFDECNAAYGGGGCGGGAGSAPSSRHSSVLSPNSALPPGGEQVENPLRSTPRSSLSAGLPPLRPRTDSLASSTNSSKTGSEDGSIEGRSRSGSGQFFARLSTQPLMKKGRRRHALSTSSPGGIRYYSSKLSTFPKLIGSLLSDVPARVDPVRHLASTALMAMECSWFVMVALFEPIYTLSFERYVVGIAGVVVGGMMMLRLLLDAWVNGEHYKKLFARVELEAGGKGREGGVGARWSRTDQDRELSRLARKNAQQQRQRQDSFRVRDHKLGMLFGMIVLVQASLCAGVVQVTGWSGGECFKVDCGVGGVCEPGFGSYTCECLAGYYEVVAGDGNCIDMVECETESHECGPHGTCTNTPGDYTCKCDSGYTMVDTGSGGHTCEVDYCVSGTLLGTPHKISSGVGGLPASVLNTNDHFGTSVAILGDVDGDGNTDLAVGAVTDDSGGHNWGAVYVLFLNPDGVSVRESSSDNSKGFHKISFGPGGGMEDALIKNNANFGKSIAALGDLNEDGGIVDMAVGAPKMDAQIPSVDDGGGYSSQEFGAVYIIFLQNDGSVKSHKKISNHIDGGITTSSPSFKRGGMLGSSLDCLGYFANQDDGLFAIVVGAEDTEGVEVEEGEVYILFLTKEGTVDSGAPNGGYQSLKQANHDLFSSVAEEHWFGSAVAPLGDVNGDTIDDIAVGASGYDNSREGVFVVFLDETGAAIGGQVIYDDGGGLEDTEDFDKKDYFGSAVGGLGDVDGDGTPDMAVGSYGDGGNYGGAVYMLLLTPEGGVKRHYKMIPNIIDGLGLAADSRFGRSLAAVGDLNGDGVIELIVGTPYQNEGGKNDCGALVLLDVPVGYVPVCDDPDEECSMSSNQNSGANTGGGGVYVCTSS